MTRIDIDEPTRQGRQSWANVSGWVLAAFFTARLLAADIAGVVTNDSLGYLSRASSDVFANGLVVQGYRQVAQPLWIAVNDVIASITGWDRVFGVAITQRTVLFVGILLVIYALRWWSVPALMVITTPVFSVHADFILPEGFLIPWCVVAAGISASVATGRPLTRRFPVQIAMASGFIAFISSTIKLQYTSLLCLTASIVWIFWKEGRMSRRAALVILGVPYVLSASLALAQSFENHDELGVFEPVSERARAEWYGAWQATYVVEKDNRTDESQATWFDEGNLYTFLKGIEADVPAYIDRVDLVDARIDDMFEAAGTSHRREQGKAFIGGLQGGRTDDLAGIVNQALASTNTDQRGRLTLNNVGREGGVPAVLQRVNESRPAGFLATSTIFRRFGSLYRDYRPHKGSIATVGIVLLLASLLARGSHRPTSLATLGLMVSVSAALGSAYIDNARYLLGPLAIVIIMASVAVRSFLMQRFQLEKLAAVDT